MDINAILIALGVVAGVGLVMGIVLALASKFFAVDAKVMSLYSFALLICVGDEPLNMSPP